MISIDFHFSGVFHVYAYNTGHERDIEDFFVNVYDNTRPSKSRQSAYEILRESGFYDTLLELKEIEDIHEEEFYFEIVGKGKIEHICFETECGTEHDIEYYLTDYKVYFIDQETADKFL